MQEVRAQIGHARGAFEKMRTLLCRSELSLKTKSHIIRCYVFLLRARMEFDERVEEEIGGFGNVDVSSHVGDLLDRTSEQQRDLESHGQ